MHQALCYNDLTSLELYLEIAIIIPMLKMKKLRFSFSEQVDYNVSNDIANKQ